MKRSLNIDYKQIRFEVFSEPVQYDPELAEMVKGFPSHNKIANPASQNLFQYLTRYVKTVSELHFGKPIRDIQILDWGCGMGQITYMLRKNGADPLSCDIKRQADDSAFGQPTPIIDRCNIDVIPLEHDYKLPFEDASMDVVLSCGVLEHVANDIESLKEINRILKPSGLFLCFFLPYFLSWTQHFAHMRKDYYHDHLYRVGQARNMLRDTNFNLFDIWHRQLFPKNSVRYPNYRWFEKCDQFLVNKTFLKYFVTNIEFLAVKRG